MKKIYNKIPFIIYIYFIKGTQTGRWDQCGGIGYNGSTTCVSGLTCYLRDIQYSMCDISCPAGWLCSTTNKTTFTTSTIITTTTIAQITNLTTLVAKLEQFKGKKFDFFNTFIPFLIINLN